MRSMLWIFIVVILAISTVACSEEPPAQAAASENSNEQAVSTETEKSTDTPGPGQIGAPAAPLKGLAYIKGEPVTFKKDKIYVVEFWQTWCPPCQESIPHLTKLQKLYKDKVTILGVSSESAQTVRPFVEKKGDKMDYTVAVDPTGKVVNDYMEVYGQEYIPTAFIVDGQGRVVWVGSPLEGFDEVLEKVVAGSFDPKAYAKEKAEREALEIKLKALFNDYFTALLSGESKDETRPIAEQIIEIGHAAVLDGLAWQILSLKDASLRDTEIAMKAVQKANDQTKGENPSVLDTYARALYLTGKVNEAVELQQKAVTLATDNEQMQAQLKKRLEQYKQAAKE